MYINDYTFGNTRINGESYEKDVIVLPDKVQTGWIRARGHHVSPEDLGDIIAEKPDVVIFGTGKNGVLKVPQETRKFLEDHGIEVFAYRTPEAVDLFNNSPKCRKIVLALHLTC